MTRISSAEVADIMIRDGGYMTITDVTVRAAALYPDMQVTRQSVSNIIRHFARSHSAICQRLDGVYPHQYRLLGLDGYQFKVRHRTPDYDHLVVKNCRRIDIETRYNDATTFYSFAHQLWSGIRKKALTHD